MPMSARDGSGESYYAHVTASTFEPGSSTGLDVRDELQQVFARNDVTK
jgi:hypothetical protein